MKTTRALNTRRILMAAVTSAALALGIAAAAQAGAIPKDVSLAPLVKEVSPAVVNISTRGTVEVEDNAMFRDPMFRRFFNLPEGGQPRERETASLGSGVIVDAANGYILTNEHVISDADEITVQLVDGRELEAEVIGQDEQSDIAVLKINNGKLSALKIGNSDSLEVGDYVLALGNPFGLGHTVTSGIVSAKGRSGLGIESYEDFIQTDAAINRGNSGGALINLQGELVGINTAILGPGGGNAGIGFAIPTSMARNIMEQILEYGEVKRGLLGITGSAVNAVIADVYDLDEIRGAVVTRVTEGSGADEAGIKEDDVILEVDGDNVDNFQDLRNTIGLRRPGEKVELTIVRDGKQRRVTATLGEYQQVAQADSREERRSSGLGGATLSAIPDDHPLYGEVEGVVVESPGSSTARREGLQRGDIITSINREPVASMRDVNRILGESERYLVKVRRNDAAFFVVID
ncbi:MAG: DegQ family serine endoprotease [Xanthomonadales bacterium]|nr:DegQ family serine endoprotease [Xanthomonadales bacterium]